VSFGGWLYSGRVAGPEQLAARSLPAAYPVRSLPVIVDLRRWRVAVAVRCWHKRRSGWMEVAGDRPVGISAIGATPVVRLARLAGEGCADSPPPLLPPAASAPANA